MKRISFIILSLVCFIGNSFAEDTVSGVILGYEKGTEWTMHVLLNNDENYVAFQMDITLPTGMTVESVKALTSRLAQGSNVTIGDESTETPFVVDYNTIDETNNVVRVVAYNLGNNAISGTKGEHIIKLALKSSEEIAYNTVTASCSNIKFVKVSDLSAATLAYDSTTDMLLGDANIDGRVSVTDFTVVANKILGNTPATYSELAADVNVDERNTVTDLTGIANIILYKSITPSTSSTKSSTVDFEEGEKIVGE